MSNINPPFQTGDEMSKRAKFILVTWVGAGVSVMKKAKMSTDKALMKDVIQVFFKDFPSTFSEVFLKYFRICLWSCS